MGSEAAKFTAETEDRCREAIRNILIAKKAHGVVSGGCHLGGVDIWAVEEALCMGLGIIEHKPRTRSWPAYRDRNILIAQDSTAVVCFTVRKLPEHYDGMRFKLCYHCGTTDHVKSGGCWTTKYARSIGKPGYTIVID